MPLKCNYPLCWPSPDLTILHVSRFTPNELHAYIFGEDDHVDRLEAQISISNLIGPFLTEKIPYQINNPYFVFMGF